ncbi:MAG: LEA type 2 family protein [Spirochaetales bacterium]|nr:LEA type 2 family protein [Spirochaetales bacterium]
MKNIVLKIAVFAGLLCLLSGCADLSRYIKIVDSKQVKEDINVDIIIEKGKVLDFSMTGLKTGFRITMTNHNRYNLVLSELSYKAGIEEEIVEAKKEQDPVTIPAGKTVSMERRFSVDFIQLAKSAVSFIDKKELHYTITCNCTFTRNNKSAQKSVDSSGTIPVPQLPAIALADAATGTIDICGFTYNVKIKVDNPNPFWLEIKGFDYDLFVNKNSLLSITNKTVQQIKAGSVSYIDIPIVVAFTDIAKVVPDMFSREKLDVTLEGNVEYDSFLGNEESPVHVDDAITLPQLPRITIARIEPVISMPPKLTITLDIFNPNDFDITMALFDFVIYFSGSKIIQSKKQGILLQSNKTNRTKLTAEINASLLNSITGKKQVSYAVKGKFEFTSTIGTLTIPLDISGDAGVSQ